MILLLLSLLFACLFLGVPIFVSLGIATAVTLVVSDLPTMLIAQSLYQGIDKFPLLAIPCFILAGSVMERVGITQDIIDVILMFWGKVTGGLGIATILACMFFSSISGSGPGTVAAVGTLMIPAMLRAGYGRAYAGAVSSSGGTLGILIPPSNPMIIYGVIAQCSITGLFIAGVIPGVIIGVAHCLVAYVVARHLKFERTNDPFIFREFLCACWRGKFSLAAPVVILGGIYGGIFTPVEASVVAVVYALLVGLLVKRQLTFGKLLDSCTESARIPTAMILVGTSTVFGQVLIFNNAPIVMLDLLMGISTNWFVILLLIILVFVILGMFMETLSTIIIVTPILLPVVTQLGIDPIHFGIIFVVTNEVAFLTPPLGANLFVGSQLAKVSIERLSLHVLPHIFAILVCIVLIAYFEELSLWLPHLLGYGLG